jgi:TetR/AcrR family transcriptional repressor of nem operon
MARTKEFDQDLALENAIRLFSQQGYAATSTDDLMQVMGIGRQSMYDTFGDKKALFLKAMQRYSEMSCGLIGDELSKTGSPLLVLRNTLIAFAERKDMASSEGCMGLNALSEFGLRDSDVNVVMRSAATNLRKQIMGLLNKAAKMGDLPEKDVTSATDFVEATLAGIRYAAKAGSSRKALRALAEFAGSALVCRSR